MGTKAEHFMELHQSDSEADSLGYDSDDQQARLKTKASSKKTGKAAAATKAKVKPAASAKGRRATFDAFAKNNSSDEDDSDAEVSEEDEEEDDNEEGVNDSGDNDIQGQSDPRFQLEASDDDNDDQDNTNASEDKEHDDEDKAEEGGKKKSKKDKRKKVQPLTPEELAKFQAAYEKTGIVYISRIPPFMKPIKIRHLLSQFGEIGRVYLAAEDAKIAARRKKYGGNKKQNYTEGWVEFKDKTVAKTVARTLNTTIIGGKKNSHYHDDIWNIKYLPKFKWNHLTERIAYENASRAQRLQAEINQAKRENKAILANIEKSKMIQSIEEKKAAKRKAAGSTAEETTTTTATGAGAEEDKSKQANIRRAFKQRKLETESSAKPVEGKMKSVLSSVFGRTFASATIVMDTSSACGGISISRLTRTGLAILGSLAVLSSVASGYQARSLKASSDDDVKALLSLEPSDPSRFNPHNGALLAPFMIPRVSGTANNTIVQKFILDYFQKLNESSIAGQPFNGLITPIAGQENKEGSKKSKRAPGPVLDHKGIGWHVELDEFEDDTPYGKKKFTNIIMTKNPNAENRLVFAAHFDSKYFPPHSDVTLNNGGDDTLPFIAATDSAGPCAIMLDLAASLDRLLDNPSRTDKDTTLQLIFFDGEEAFVEWNGNDNTYGSRHLANLWANTKVTKSRLATGRNHGDSATKLDGIELFVLLDLLGSEAPRVPSWFKTTSWAHRHTQGVEQRLWAVGLNSKDGKVGGDDDNDDDLQEDLVAPMLTEELHYGGIADDHEAFMKLGVPIFHVIPYPFPKVWHTLNDNADAINQDVLTNWAHVFRVFAAEYLDLIPSQIKVRRRDEL
ncbi:hypothetical protein BGZ73_003890 [Actinomortierella ambigua]|nr:hypothetical protein BGZ73_003890 [Actinomortierella ambigua]